MSFDYNKFLNKCKISFQKKKEFFFAFFSIMYVLNPNIIQPFRIIEEVLDNFSLPAGWKEN